MAAIALARGLNANLVHGWLSLSKAAQKRSDSVAQVGDARFIEMKVPSTISSVATPRDIQVDVRRGSMTVSVTWPAEFMSEFAVWMRELLR